MAKIEWKTPEDLKREEENRPLTDLEKLKKENEMLGMAILELSSQMLKGGK